LFNRLFNRFNRSVIEISNFFKRTPEIVTNLFSFKYSQVTVAQIENISLAHFMPETKMTKIAKNASELNTKCELQAKNIFKDIYVQNQL